MKKFFAIFAVAAMLFACEEPVPETTLSLDNEADATLNLSIEAVEKVVAFSTNAAWTATDDAEWINVTPAEGVAGTAIELTIAVEENTTFDGRTGKVTITAGDKVVEVAVNQGQVDEVNVGELEVLYVGYEGGEVELPVNHNIEYTVSVVEEEVDWASVGGTRALATTKTIINVAQNLTGADRTCTLLVEAAGFEYEVLLTQSGKAFSTTMVDVFGAQLTGASITYGGDFGAAMVSIATLGDKIVVCSGNGVAPKLLDKKTGEVVGTLNTGDFVPYYVENDDAGNLVMCNRNYLVDGAWNVPFNVYYMTSETATPVKLIDKGQYGGLGAAFDVRGDVTKNAILLAPHEGIEGVSMAYSVEVWTITDGVAGASAWNNVTGITPLWGAAAWAQTPQYFPAFALVGETLDAGALYGFYDNNNLHYMDATYASTVVATAMYDWQRSLGAIDVHNVNGAPVAVITGGDMFAQYGANTTMYVLDVATKTAVATLTTFNQATDFVIPEGGTWFTFWNAGNATVDVCFETIEGGIAVYYIDNNLNSIEGLVLAL